MPSLAVSSGDPIADRRMLWAEALFDEGDAAAAAELLADTLKAVPHWAAGWYRLGEFFEAAADPEAAAAAWGKAIEADPRDRLGAALRRELLRRDTPLAQMPSAFVETLFDSYAQDFDQSLARLGYRGPQLILRELAGLGRFGRALDLGCGTGLLGIELRGHCDWLGGCDISAEMLARAKARGVYDRLDKYDLTRMPPPVPEYDLIAAADVVMYIGALESVAEWAAKSLRPGGRFVFTAEAMVGSGYALGETRRYRHSARYLTDVLTDAGFAAPRLSPGVVRHDRGQPVEAFVISAERPTAALSMGDFLVGELAKADLTLAEFPVPDLPMAAANDEEAPTAA